MAQLLIGSLLKGFGGSGKQGKQVVDFENLSTSERNMLEEMISQFSQQGLQLPVEDPQSKAWRDALMGQHMAEFQKLQQPIIGKREKAAGIQNIQEQFAQALKGGKQALAKSGALDSGRAAQMAMEIMMGRAGETTDFLSQIPLQNELARREGMFNWMGQGLGLGQLAPIGQFSTQAGTQRSTGTRQETSKQQQTGRQAQTKYGPGFWKSFLGQLGQGVGGPGFEFPSFGRSGATVLPGDTFGGPGQTSGWSY